MPHLNMNIEHAVSDALAFAGQRPDDVRPVETSDGGLYASIASFDDHEIVQKAHENGFRAAGNQIVVDTPDDFIYALRAIARQTGTNIPDGVIDANLAHEREHEIAALAIGATAVKYGVSVESYRKGLFFSRAHGPYTREVKWEPFTAEAGLARPITKLEQAATVAAPKELSDNDDLFLRRMGYTDANDVAARIIAHNARRGVRQIPVPASY